MRTIFVSHDFPLNRRMRKAVQRGKLQVVREGGKRLTMGGSTTLQKLRLGIRKAEGVIAFEGEGEYGLDNEAATRNLVLQAVGKPVKMEFLKEGFVTNGVFFPNGTLFAGVDKKNLLFAAIVDSEIVAGGESFNSFHGVTKAVTDGRNSNGWDFWWCRFPGDSRWIVARSLPSLSEFADRRKSVPENMLPWRDMPEVLLAHAAHMHPWLAKCQNGNFAEGWDGAKMLENAVMRRVRRDQFNKALEELPPREASIIRMRYGLGKYSHPAELGEIGSQFDVTRERIRQIEAKLLRKLRHVPRF